ncbi:ATP-binding protein, partial [Cetobacterium sp.]|uniref:sensor histidine kinase n=1 Tax=Cetobacterium sp. TaxID=2071632 RepID=UPI003F376B0E
FLELYPYLDLTAVQNRSIELKDKRKFQLITTDIDRFKVLIFYKFKPVNEIFPMLKLYFSMKIGLLILVTVFLGFLIEKLIIKPIISLANNTNKIGSLNHNFSLNYSSNDEIGYLYKNIKRMTEKLENIIYFYKKENQDNIKSKLEFENELKLFMHEIKTPLSAIIGFTDLFLEKNESENIKIVNEEGKRLLRLANELIHKKNVTNQIVLNKEVFDITELTDLILKIYENELQNLNVVFLSPSIFVNADKEKVKQVIINLLSNAIEHANSLIKIDIEEDSEGKIKFTIENDGEKLSNKNLNNIWKKYYSTKSNHGRGLGLYITSEIIKLHENTYGVDLTENGIAFYFYLDKNE